MRSWQNDLTFSGSHFPHWWNASDYKYPVCWSALDVSRHLSKPKTVPWFPFRETSSACVHPRKGRNQGVLPLEAGKGMQSTWAIWVILGTLSGWPRLFVLLATAVPRLERDCSLDLRLLPFLQLSCLSCELTISLERIFSASVLQGYLLCLWLKQLLQPRAGPPALLQRTAEAMVILNCISICEMSHLKSH